MCFVESNEMEVRSTVDWVELVLWRIYNWNMTPDKFVPSDALIQAENILYRLELEHRLEQTYDRESYFL